MTARTAVSFEVYPPRSPAKLPGLHESIKALATVAPEFISVTSVPEVLPRGIPSMC